MLNKGCFYCGEIAITIDRIDSTIDHTPENCVASCWGCNNSKGAADPATFIRKAYYRVRSEYVDYDIDIWSIIAQKPSLWHYKNRAKKKKIPFDLTKEDFDVLIRDACKYCQRSPTTWFGIDRVVPSLGYVLENVVSCCFDCNVDKLEDDIDTMMARNERIANRVDAGELVITSGPKVTLHKGVQKTSKKVCAYGIVYTSKREASRAIGKGHSYVTNCIRDGTHSNDIFVIV